MFNPRVPGSSRAPALGPSKGKGESAGFGPVRIGEVLRELLAQYEFRPEPADSAERQSADRATVAA